MIFRPVQFPLTVMFLQVWSALREIHEKEGLSTRTGRIGKTRMLKRRQSLSTPSNGWQQRDSGVHYHFTWLFHKYRGLYWNYRKVFDKLFVTALRRCMQMVAKFRGKKMQDVSCMGHTISMQRIIHRLSEIRSKPGTLYFLQ